MLDYSLMYDKFINKTNSSDLDYYLKGENIKYPFKEFLNLSREKLIKNIIKF